MDTTTDQGPDLYAPGRSAGEALRLIRQSRIYGPISRRFLTEAGIAPGMRVLDVGSGSGDVALLLAELVGPGGEVVGFDTNGDILEMARARAEASGRANVRFRQGDAADATEGSGTDAEFDAVVGRWVLMYQPDPAALLRRLTRLLRPGGIVTFHEGEFVQTPTTFPPAPLHGEVHRWTTPPPGAPGPDVHMGLRLYASFVAAGLPGPELRLEAPIGGGPDWAGYDYLADTVRSLLPFLEAMGAVSGDVVDIDTLGVRLRDEIVERHGVQVLPMLIGAWATTPAPD
jgi:SAM-dependent methyltransferase